MLQKITPHIWFESEARDAAKWYVEIFRDSSIVADVVLPDTPSGEANIIMLKLWGHEFQFLSAGPMFQRNPAVSYMIAVPTVEQVNELWRQLVVGGQVLMPIDTYPFCQRYGWLRDRFGVSWQIMHDGGMKVQSITPCFLFTGDVCGRAEEAMNYWIQTVKDGGLLEGHISRYPAGMDPDREGTLQYARFRLGRQEFVVMDSAQSHEFGFNEMQSLMLYVETQEEIERYSNALSRVPEAEQCGWVKDQFGISWQIVPIQMDRMMIRATSEQMARLTAAFLPMKRLNIAKMEEAFRNS